MFNFPKLSSIILKHINMEKENWTDAKKVSEGLSLILYPDVKSQMDNTFFNKLFTGRNKGGGLYKLIQAEIKSSGFSSYIFDVEKRFKAENNRERQFQLAFVLHEVYEAVTLATNLSGSIQKGLVESYLRNRENRPYLFLAECLFYSLKIQKSALSVYTDIDFDQEPEIVNSLLDNLIIDNKKYSSRTIHDLNMLSVDEISLFKKIAPFTFFDESFDELSGEHVFDHQLISHEEFFDLYEKYNVKAIDISRLIDCRLLSGGGRNELVIEKDSFSGFQNDDLVLAMTTEKERIIFDFKVFHLTQSAKDLVEILNMKYDNQFFEDLAESIKRELKDSAVQVMLINVEDFEEMGM